MNGGSRSLAVALAATLLGSAAPALAQPKEAKPASEKDRQIASDLVKKAIAKSSANDHAAAIKLYLQAYTLLPNSLLLSNIGAEFQQDGMPKEALEYFCKYLLEDPTGTNAPYARSQAKILSRQLGKRKVADKDVCAKDRDDDEATEDAARGDTGRTETGRTEIGRTEPRESRDDIERPIKPPRDTGAAIRPAVAERSQPVEPPGEHLTREEPSNGNAVMMYGGVGIGVAGLIVAGFGGYYGYRAKQISDEITSHPTNQPWPKGIGDIEARGQRYEDAQIKCLIASGVLVTAGIVLYIVGRPDGSHDRGDKLTVRVTPTANGAAVFGQF
jgi:tetratricopeptide (TPR) repeat protein